MRYAIQTIDDRTWLMIDPEATAVRIGDGETRAAVQPIEFFGPRFTPALREDLCGSQSRATLDLLLMLARQLNLTVVGCSWCEAVLGVKVRCGGDLSHGICATCADAYRDARRNERSAKI